MKPGDTIELAGEPWQIHAAKPKQHPTRLVLMRANADLADWRKSKGFTVRQAAAFLGVSHSTIVKIEQGTRVCPNALAAKIAR